MTNKDPIPMYWWFRDGCKTNFGDIVSPLVVKKLSGRDIKFSRGENKLVAAGSILVHALNGDYIWGTGAHFPNEGNKRKLKICAVRGPLTKERLEKDGHECPAVYGDPSMLLPYIYKPDVIKRYDIGVIPHYVDYKLAKGGMYGSSINVIDILSGIKNVIIETNKCRCVLASSLHGIMLGESYGISTGWIRFSNKIASKEFKFQDYYLSTGRTVQVIDWTERWNIPPALAKCYQRSKPILARKQFLLSFPFLKDDIKELSDIETEIIK